MEKIAIISAFIFLASFAGAQDPHSDLKKIRILTLQGLKAIRRDELHKMNFRRAHELALEIRKEKKELKTQ